MASSSQVTVAALHLFDSNEDMRRFLDGLICVLFSVYEVRGCRCLGSQLALINLCRTSVKGLLDDPKLRVERQPFLASKVVLFGVIFTGPYVLYVIIILVLTRTQLIGRS
jgi:hypothetical protein